MTITKYSLSRTDLSSEYIEWKTKKANGQLRDPFSLSKQEKELLPYQDYQKIYDNYYCFSGERFVQPYSEWESAIRAAIENIKNNAPIVLPEWITITKCEVIKESVGTTHSLERNSSYYDGLNDYWMSAHYFDNEFGTIQHCSLAGWDAYSGNIQLPSGLWTSANLEVFSFDYCSIDATQQVLDKVAAIRAKEAYEKAEKEIAARMNTLSSQYINNIENNGLVFAKAAYKPRKGTNKVGFEKGMLGIVVYSGSGDYGDYYIVRFGAIGSKAKADGLTTLSQTDKFSAYIPSIEFNKKNELTDEYGYFGKYFAQFLFTHLYGESSGRNGKVQNLQAFDKVVCELLEFIQADNSAVIEMSRKEFRSENIGDYSDFVSIIRNYYSDYFSFLLQKADDRLPR